MTPSRTIRVLFLGSMLVSMAVVMVWAGVIGWRKWPEWRAVREMRAAVEANEPGRFLDAVEAVDSLGVADWAADEIAPLRHHAEPRVRMVAIIALTVLRPRGPEQAQELIDLIDNPKEDPHVCHSAAICLVLFGEHARAAVPTLKKVFLQNHDSRRYSAYTALVHLGKDVTGPLPSRDYGSATPSGWNGRSRMRQDKKLQNSCCG